MQTQISKYVEIDGKKLVYEIAGEGETLVLAHAGFLDSGMWDQQFKAFGQHYRVIRYDMRGFGKSDALDGPVARREELYQLLKHLEVNSAYLVGCSMGGEMMIDFAIEHPEKVLGLVTVNSTPSGFEMQGEPPAEILEMIDAMQKGDLERMSEMQMRIWIDGPFRQPEQVDSSVRKVASQMNQIPVRNHTWAVADGEPANPLQPPAAQQLQNVHAPTLVVVGSLDNPEILRAADVMVAGIEGAQKAVVEGAAHIPSMEKPTEFNRIVLDFLKSIGK